MFYEVFVVANVDEAVAAAVGEDGQPVPRVPNTQPMVSPLGIWVVSVVADV